MIQILFKNGLSAEILERTTWFYERGILTYNSYWTQTGYMFEFYGLRAEENATAFKLRFGP